MNAVIAVAERTEIRGEILNVGGEREVSIRQLAELILELTGSRSEIVHVSYGEAYEPGFEDILRRLPNSEKLRALTAWRPTYALEETLRTIIDHEAAKLESVPALARAAATGD